MDNDDEKDHIDDLLKLSDDERDADDSVIILDSNEEDSDELLMSGCRSGLINNRSLLARG